MGIKIRLEEKKDFRVVEELTREAFWDVYHPGATEHLVMHKLREVSCFIPALDFVAVQDDRVVGHIAYSKAKVVNEKNEMFEVLCAGPLSVCPSLQGQGVGSLLLEYSKHAARALGFRAIALFGNPNYYHRFGFRNAAQFQITTSEGENLDAFMMLELHEGGLSGVSGKYYEDPVFNVSPEDVEEFDKSFPYREKHVTATQLN